MRLTSRVGQAGAIVPWVSSVPDQPGMIPDPPSLGQLRRLSPSRGLSLNVCPLREIWRGARHPRLLPRHPAAVLGTVAHKLLEDVGCGRITVPGQDAVSEHWDLLVGETEKEMNTNWLERSIVPLSRTARDYAVRKIRACKHGARLAETSLCRGADKKPESVCTGFEIWVESRDKLVGGFIDEAYYDQTDLVIRDYKTGAVHGVTPGNGGLLKQDYVLQLKIYAVLFQETHGRWPDRLELVPVAGDAVEVPYKRNDCVGLLGKMREALTRVNAKVSDGVPPEQLAQPSPVACAFCEFRPVCKRYKQQRAENWDGPPADVAGQIQEIARLPNGLRIKLEQDVKREGGLTATLRGIADDTNRHPCLSAVQVGGRLECFNVHWNQGAGVYETSDFTVLYWSVGGPQ